MSNVIQIRDKAGKALYPITDSSLVIGLKDGGIMENIIAWDGESVPVVANIPAGVEVEYNSTTYTGTLAASGTTSGYIYLVASNTQEGEYDRYIVNAAGGSYAWAKLSSTQIVSPTIADDLITNDATKALSARQGVVLEGEVSQLRSEVNERTSEYDTVKTNRIFGLVVNGAGKLLSVGTSYYIDYYQATEACDIRLTFTRIDAYTYNGKVFIAPLSSLVANEYVTVLTQVDVNATLVQEYHLEAGMCLCVERRETDSSLFQNKESLLSLTRQFNDNLPKYPREGCNLISLSDIVPNSIVDNNTGMIKTNSQGWRTVEVDFIGGDVKIFMKYIYTGYYAFLNAAGEVIKVAGNDYSLYWGFRLPTGTVKGRFSIANTVSDADISKYAYLSYCRPLMQDEVSNRVSYAKSFTYKQSYRPTDYQGGDITAFKEILCIGDSITRGYFNSTDGGVNIPGMTYPDNLARVTGCDVTNLGDSGESTASWWAAHQNDTELTGAKCVIIELGINDDASTLDTTTKDAMDAIIAKLKAENQKVKIFISGIPSGKSYPARLDTDSYYVKDQWLRNYYATYFANDAQVFFLDIARYTHICEKFAETYDDYNQGHLSEYGYWRLAKDYANYISYLMYNSDDTFKEIQFIGTDYSRT